MEEEQKNEQKSDQVKTELSIEKQKTKTERIKRGNGKVFSKTLCISFIVLLLTFVSTWFISIFMPDYVERAINIFINIF